MLESKFQANLIKEIKEIFPGCIVMKNDSSYIQGIPDLLVLHKNKWASLENKKSVKAKKQPNQEYYVDKMNEMSFSRFIYPENKDKVLNELYEYFVEQCKKQNIKKVATGKFAADMQVTLQNDGPVTIILEKE